MDTLLCVQTLWTPSYVSRLYGQPVDCERSVWQAFM